MNISRIVDELPIAPLDKVSFQRRLDSDPSFERALRPEFDITEEFADKIERRIRDEEANAVIESFGVGGSGKTNTMFSIGAKYLFKGGFSMKNVFFGKEAALAAAPSMEKRSTLALDENVLEYGLGRMRRESEWENIINVCRKYQLSITACSVVPRLKEWAHYGLETLFIDREARTNRVLVLKPELFAAYVSYTALGWITVPDARTVLPPEFFKEYDARKDEFIEVNLHKEGGGDFTTEAANAVLKSVEWAKLVEFYSLGRKTPRLPPKPEVMEIVDSLYPYLHRNNEAAQVVVRALMLAKLKENVVPDAAVKVRHGVIEGEYAEVEEGGKEEDKGDGEESLHRGVVGGVWQEGEGKEDGGVEVPAAHESEGDKAAQEPVRDEG